MIRVLRRMGIALGSLVAAGLCVGLGGTLLMGALGVAPSSTSSVIATLVAVILGWLIYRDILRREGRTAS